MEQDKTILAHAVLNVKKKQAEAMRHGSFTPHILVRGIKKCALVKDPLEEQAGSCWPSSTSRCACSPQIMSVLSWGEATRKTLESIVDGSCP